MSINTEMLAVVAMELNTLVSAYGQVSRLEEVSEWVRNSKSLPVLKTMSQEFLELSMADSIDASRLQQLAADIREKLPDVYSDIRLGVSSQLERQFSEQEHATASSARSIIKLIDAYLSTLK